MRLVTGGACQGKKEWVMAQWHIEETAVADGASCDDWQLGRVQAIDHFHLLVRRWLTAGENGEERLDRLLWENPDVVVITDEIGCGIVPMDEEERNYREVHGRLCCRLAKEAKSVVRVYCGIGQVLK